LISGPASPPTLPEQAAFLIVIVVMVALVGSPQRSRRIEVRPGQPLIVPIFPKAGAGGGKSESKRTIGKADDGRP
jgi:hypothetical protein